MFNVTLLKQYVGDVVPAPDPIKLDDGPEYEVDAFFLLSVGWLVVYPS